MRVNVRLVEVDIELPHTQATRRKPALTGMLSHDREPYRRSGSNRSTSGSQQTTAPTVGRPAGRADPLTPIREFIATQNSSAIVLLAATFAALVWAKLPVARATSVFGHTELELSDSADADLTLDLRHWINDGLMAFFFFVAGLEIRREFDMGELRERRRVATPVLAAIGGVTMPALIYLAINAGTPGARGWGIAMGTDTAFALGVLALVGRTQRSAHPCVPADARDRRRHRRAHRHRARVHRRRLDSGAARRDPPLRRRCSLCVRVGVRNGIAYFLVAFCIWVAMIASGVHPTIAGVALGVLATALPADARGPPASGRAVAPLPRTTDARVRPLGGIEPALLDFTERAAAAPVHPVDELRHRAAVRARERRRRASTARHSATARRRASRSASCSVSSSASSSASPARRGSRRAVGSAASPQTDHVAAARRCGRPSPASASRSRCSSRDISFEGDQLEDAKLGILGASVVGDRAELARVPRHRTAARAARRRRASATWRRRSSTSPIPSIPIATTSAVPTTRRSRSSSTPTSSARTAGGPSRSSASSLADVRRRAALRVPSPPARTTSTSTPRSRPRPPRPLATHGKFWEMHDLLFAHHDALTAEDLADYAEQTRARREQVRRRPSTPASTRSASTATAERRRERRRGHADVLRQWPPLPGRRGHRQPPHGDRRVALRATHDP